MARFYSQRKFCLHLFTHQSPPPPPKVFRLFDNIPNRYFGWVKIVHAEYHTKPNEVERKETKTVSQNP